MPGDALRRVVIDKLPFASPADPIVAARIEHLPVRIVLPAVGDLERTITVPAHIE